MFKSFLTSKILFSKKFLSNIAFFSLVRLNIIFKYIINIYSLQNIISCLIIFYINFLNNRFSNINL